MKVILYSIIIYARYPGGLLNYSFPGSAGPL